MEKEQKKKLGIAAVFTVVVAALIIGGIVWFVPHQRAVDSFNNAANGLEGRNAEVDSAIEELQSLQSGSDKPLDESLYETASSAIGQAQAAKESVPEMPFATEEIASVAEQINGMGHYDDQIKALNEAKNAFADSITQLKQVTAPSEAFVVQRITGLPNVTGVEAATEANDPNKQLNKPGGYTAAVFFSSDLVDRSKVYSDGNGIVNAGTEGGGCVEVYLTAEDAEKRNSYLGSFDGSILASGSHEVLGTCVVRTSNLLTASNQKLIAEEIKESLIRLD